MFRRIAEASGIPVTFAMAQMNSEPDDWRTILDYEADVQAHGINIVPQFPVRPVGAIISVDGSTNPFRHPPTYLAALAEPLPLDQRVARLRDLGLRSQVLAETMPHADGPVIGRFGAFELLFPQSGPIEYEPAREASIGSIAKRENRHPPAARETHAWLSHLLTAVDDASAGGHSHRSPVILAFHNSRGES